MIQDILNLSRSGREDQSRPSKNAATTMKKLIKGAGVEPWPKPFQNLRVSRENELLRSGEYSPEAIHMFIGYSRDVYQSNYRQLGDVDFIPRSERDSQEFPKGTPTGKGQGADNFSQGQ